MQDAGPAPAARAAPPASVTSPGAMTNQPSISALTDQIALAVLAGIADDNAAGTRCCGATDPKFPDEHHSVAVMFDRFAAAFRLDPAGQAAGLLWADERLAVVSGTGSWPARIGRQERTAPPGPTRHQVG